MEYAIEILKEKYELLNASYNKFVLRGSVDIRSQSAIDNRKKARDIEDALLKLTNPKTDQG